jgi:peptidoglycan/LPS O-acetylase OafA/YrhL
MLGGMVAAAHQRIRIRLTPPAVMGLAILLYWLLLWLPNTFYDHLAVLTGWGRYKYILIVSALILLFALREGGLTRLGRVSVLLGTWSYGIYLFHTFAYRLVTPALHGWPAFTAAVGITLVAAAALERWVERPIAGLLRR